jgi:hypothetical protein
VTLAQGTRGDLYFVTVIRLALQSFGLVRELSCASRVVQQAGSESGELASVVLRPWERVSGSCRCAAAIFFYLQTSFFVTVVC